MFHVQIAEAVSNWINAPLRTSLRRAYDHGVMKTASTQILNTKMFSFTETVFTLWPSVRTAKITQEYLVSLIVKRAA